MTNRESNAFVQWTKVKQKEVICLKVFNINKFFYADFTGLVWNDWSFESNQIWLHISIILKMMINLMIS